MRALFALVLSACCSLTVADDQAINKVLSKVSVDAIQAIPVEGVVAISSRGKTHFVSKNGRFIFKGQVFDAYTGEYVRTIEDARRTATKIDFGSMNLKLSDLTNIVIRPEKEKQLVLFVDPLCSNCGSLYTSLSEPRFQQYKITIVLFPALYDESIPIASKLYCLEPSQALVRLANKQYSDLDSKKCEGDYIQRTALTGRLLNIKQVPFLVNDKGSFRYGSPPDLYQWAES